MMAAQTTNLETPSGNGRKQKPNRLNSGQWFLLGLVAAGGVLVSAELFWILKLHERQIANVQFCLGAEKKVEALKQAIGNQLSVMTLVRAFYAGSQEVERDEFRIFTDSVFKEHPDIKMMAWMPLVRSKDRRTYEEAVRNVGFPEYQISERRGDNLVPAAERDEYFPILYIEPQDKHQEIMGLDLGSLPECLAAINRSKSVLGPAITYFNIPGIGDNSEFTIYMFEDAHTARTSLPGESNSARSPDGYILGTFHLRDALKRSLEILQPTGVDIYLYDVTVPEKSKLIYSSASRISVTPLPAPDSPPREGSVPIHYEARISVADRTWLAYCFPTDVYFQDESRWEPWAALLAGLLFTGLVSGFVFLLIGRTARIEQIAAKRTQELMASEQRFRLLVDNAADAFYVHEPDGLFLDVNKRASEQTGYTREELLSMHVFDLEVGFKPEDHHELIWMRPASDFPINVQGVHRRKDGSTFPVEVRLNCLETGGRRLILALARDVTERRQAEEALRKEQRFLRHLIDLQERERKLTAYEIHDGLAQQLTGALFKLQGLEIAQQKQDFEGASQILDDCLRLLSKSVDEARRLIGGLRPPILDESGIVAAIAYLCSEHNQGGGPQVEFAHEVQFHRLAPPLEVALFRIAQECLTNASRYSKSPKVRVELNQLKNRVRLTVKDWGVGFDPQEVKGNRYGLRGINERVRLLGGTVDMNSAPGQGTTVIVELPLLEGDSDEDDNGMTNAE